MFPPGSTFYLFYVAFLERFRVHMTGYADIADVMRQVASLLRIEKYYCKIEVVFHFIGEI